MPPPLKQAFETMTEFAIVRNIISANIGYVPNIKYDPLSLSGHRVRIFRDPSRVDVVYSERSLARYIELADIFWQAQKRDSPEVLAAGLMVTRASDDLRRDKFNGIALLARGLDTIGFKKLPDVKMISTSIAMASAESDTRVYNLAGLFLPLAHEIGHVPEAQAIGPKVIYSNEILETYRLNYARVRSFTGDFNYEASLSDTQSPLNLETLRQEIMSDYFAVNTVCALIVKVWKNGEPFPLMEFTSSLLSFPLIMALQSICLAGPRSKREVQDITLAMHCRYSVIIDSVRGTLKSVFKSHPNRQEIFAVIDQCVDTSHDAFGPLYVMSWKAIMRFSAVLTEVAPMSADQVLSSVAKTNSDLRRRLVMADYLDVIAFEIAGYPVGSANLKELQAYGRELRTFDTAVIGRDSVRLIR